MKTKKGVTGIVYRPVGGAPLFLAVHRVLNWTGWEFPKGGVEEGETETQAVIREVIEETGLTKLKIKARLKAGLEWESEGIKYIYSVFLIESGSREVKLQTSVVEHDAFKWCTPWVAQFLLTHKENKALVPLALEYLSGKHSARLHAIVTGRVQGVFFRKFTFDSAHEIGGLTGFVKNLSDGSVEVVAEGKKASLELLLEKLKQGPSKAKIEKIKHEFSETKREFQEFVVIDD
ncbi:MAG: acylphosphatase [Candidatus Diapherotrites archaeon]|nr:acylphosphatase [Candidatus Diapherotrites archaeon]